MTLNSNLSNPISKKDDSSHGCSCSSTLDPIAEEAPEQQLMSDSNESTDDSEDDDEENYRSITGTEKLLFDIKNPDLIRTNNRILNKFSTKLPQNNFLFFADNDICFSAWCADCLCFMPDHEELTFSIECMVPCMDGNFEITAEFIGCEPKCGTKLNLCCAGLAADPGTACTCIEESVGSSGEIICCTKSIL